MPSSSAVTISACLIVRNEATMLDACLQTLAGVDDLVVVDTGSTDDTVAIASRHGARIGHAVWSGDFAAARNVSLDMALGDWILVIDADHRLVGGIEAVRDSIRAHGDAQNVLCPVIQNLDAQGRPASSYRSGQVFRRTSDRRFVGRIHERIADAGAPLKPVWVEGWRIDHLGFTPAMRADRAKVARNLALLQRWTDEHPHDADAWYYLGAEYQMAGQLDAARQAYERGLTAIPGVVETSLLRINLLGVLESQRGWSEVVDRALAWRADGAHYPDFWLIAGRAALRTGRLALAEEWFHLAVGFGPDRPVAFETAGARTWKPAAYQALLAAETGNWSLVRRLLAPWRGEVGQDPFLMRLYLHAGLVGATDDALRDEVLAILAQPLTPPLADAVDEVLQHFPVMRAAVTPRLGEFSGGRWLLARQCQRTGDWSGMLRWAADDGLPVAGAHLLRGLALMGIGRHDEASFQLAEACRLAPEMSEAWSVRAALGAALGQDDAWTYWQEALSTGAELRPLLDAMARHALATGDATRARTVHAQLQQVDPMHPLLWPLGDLWRRS